MPRQNQRCLPDPLHATGVMLLLLCGLLLPPAPAFAKDLMAPKQQEITEVDPSKLPSFDQQQKGTPQSLFTWIVMAKGYEVEWDTFGRQGWYTQDPRLKPIEPGTTVFSPETPAVYIVFEVAPLEDPAQFSALWFLEDEHGKISETPAGRDTLAVPGHERYGFLELRKPRDGWPKGTYLVKLYITPEGQQIHAANQVGTMRFKITDQPVTSSATPPKN
jgi:hypothetical protein